ncbi:MAG: 16S rRNA (uracil(1498)-N(3))-methyltransferase [Syntrophomonadaceae bacterium]|nr:16S rRNA (uracil(1498)-N(3))-methyltransferase [Syntrophomonadaceae bacterium]MDD3022775.1 16S rRNA (uracil(1498)-N(3))-methyltransferase [Syntrophomonadaceae bacterium]
MHRFFVAPENIYGQIVHIDAAQARHIEKVLRLKAGDPVLVFDGAGNEYQVKLLEKEKEILKAEIEVKVATHREQAVRIILVQGIPKGDKMDTIIQKAVEIGVTSIIPLTSAYSVVRLTSDKAVKKVQRWQLIAQEACKQCRRNTIPKVEAVSDFTALFNNMGENPVIMLYEHESQIRLGTILKANRHCFMEREIYLLVGPEGGFSPQEVEEARRCNVFVAGLGPNILRTETAGLTAAGIVLYEYGELG